MCLPGVRQLSGSQLGPFAARILLRQRTRSAEDVQEEPMLGPFGDSVSVGRLLGCEG